MRQSSNIQAAINLTRESFSRGTPVTVIQHHVSEEEFFAITDEDSNVELFDGEMIMRSPASRRHEELFAFLFSLLKLYVEEEDLGVVLGSRFPLRLARDRLVEPECIFIDKANARRITQKLVQAPVGLVVEILSPTTRRDDLGFKRQAYREARIKEIWLIDPEQRVVIVDRISGRGYRSSSIKRGKVTSRAVTGFFIQAEWLWKDPLPRTLSCLDRIRA